MYCLGCSNDEGRESGGVQGIRGERAKEEEGGEKRRRLREKARVKKQRRLSAHERAPTLFCLAEIRDEPRFWV